MVMKPDNSVLPLDETYGMVSHDIIKAMTSQPFAVALYFRIDRHTQPSKQ